MTSETVLTNTSDTAVSPTRPTVKLGILVSATGIGVFLTSIDQTIVNVSLPAIRSDFNVLQSEIQWVIIVYLLTVIAFTATFGDLGDRLGNKLVFQLGMFVFVLGSFLCFISPSLLLLILSRILQAIGGAAMIANGIAIIAHFTDDTNRGTAIGINAFIISIGLVVGPVVGGFLTEHLGWPFIFLINVPIGLFGLFWVQFAIPRTGTNNYDFENTDPLGAVSFAGFLMLFVFGLTVLTDNLIVNKNLFGTLSIVASILLLALFILWERYYKEPIIDLSLFKNRRYAISVFSALFANIALCGFIFQLPFFLHDILSYPPTAIGSIVLVTAITMALTGILSGYLSNFIDTHIIATVGLAGISFSLFLSSILLSVSIPYGVLVSIAFLLGLSLGSFISPNTNCLMGSIPAGKEGISNGLLGLASNVGFAVGTALTTAIFSINLKISIRFHGGTIYDPINYISATRWLFFGFGVMILIVTLISYFRGSDKAYQKK